MNELGVQNQSSTISSLTCRYQTEKNCNGKVDASTLYPREPEILHKKELLGQENRLLPENWHPVNVIFHNNLCFVKWLILHDLLFVLIILLLN